MTSCGRFVDWRLASESAVVLVVVNAIEYVPFPDISGVTTMVR